MFALCDCNNFYASCERLFRPDLESRPVAVLSNNDGCVIARSAEVKALGVPMGAPYFKEEGRFRHFGVEVFSSNFPLYEDPVSYTHLNPAKVQDLPGFQALARPAMTPPRATAIPASMGSMPPPLQASNR